MPKLLYNKGLPEHELISLGINGAAWYRTRHKYFWGPLTIMR